MSYLPQEVRYLHDNRLLLISYPDGPYELKISDLYYNIYKVSPDPNIYIEYIQSSNHEITFGFSDYKSYTIDLVRLIDLAEDTYTSSAANGS